MPQGSVLGPLLFLLFINDITNVVRHCKIRLFADDTCLFIEVDNRNVAAQEINDDLQNIQLWANQWLITFSPPKTKSLIVSNKVDRDLNPRIQLNGYDIEEVRSHTYLGLTFSNDLRWSHHIDEVATKARKRMNLMIPLKLKLDRNSLQTMYFSFVLPAMEYANVVWGGSPECNISKLEKIHTDGMRLVTGATARSKTEKLYIETGWQSINERISNSTTIMIYKIKNNIAPQYLIDLFPGENQERTTRALRNNENIALLGDRFLRLETFKNSFLPKAITLWNDLPTSVRKIPSVELFKAHLKSKKKEPNILYFYGQRWPSVHHTRLRVGCSKLNFDLCKRLHVINYQTCSCGHKKEDAYHFFIKCPNYNDLRTDLFSSISVYSHVSLPIILQGNPKLNIFKNKFIFDAVHQFITKSKRFQ